MWKRVSMFASILSLITVVGSIHPTIPKPIMAHTVPLLLAKPKVSKPAQKGKWIPMIATWYDGHEGINGTGTGITKSGVHVQAGTTIAVDPKVIPLGSRVEVRFANGETHDYVAEDTGSDIVGHHIDIYNPSRQECLKNGVQDVWIRVEKEVN